MMIRTVVFSGAMLAAMELSPATPRLASQQDPRTAELRRAVTAWVAGQRDAYRRADAAAFQPCPDSNAVVLTDIERVDHRCIDVQRHMRDRLSGTLDITVDSVWAHGDSGIVLNSVHFRRRVQRDGVWQARELVAWHRDHWRRIRGRWTLIRMVETRPQQAFVDGRPAPSTSTSPATPLLLVQNRYYAKPGREREVYEWRRHASDVLRQLGLHPGVVLQGPGRQNPDAVWQVELDSATLAREARVARDDSTFKTVMEHMGTLTRHFESAVYVQRQLRVEGDSTP